MFSAAFTLPPRKTPVEVPNLACTIRFSDGIQKAGLASEQEPLISQVGLPPFPAPTHTQYMSFAGVIMYY